MSSVSLGRKIDCTFPRIGCHPPILNNSLLRFTCHVSYLARAFPFHWTAQSNWNYSHNVLCTIIYQAIRVLSELVLLAVCLCERVWDLVDGPLSPYLISNHICIERFPADWGKPQSMCQVFVSPLAQFINYDWTKKMNRTQSAYIANVIGFSIHAHHPPRTGTERKTQEVWRMSDTCTFTYGVFT